MTVTRRAVVLGGLGAAGLLAGRGGWQDQPVTADTTSTLPSRFRPRPYRAAFRTPPVVRPASGPGPHLTLRMQEQGQQVLPGSAPRTTICGYEGGFPGPTVQAERGTPLTVRFRNRLPDKHPGFGTPMATSTHLHGSPSLPQFDGFANDVTVPGEVKDYDFPNTQPARTLWYHDHGVHFTAQNVYAGLAGQYHLHDPLERALLPQGDYDVPLTVSDALFGRDGQLVYDDSAHSGLWGDVILVNGVPWPVMQVQRRIYRFRVLNASIARSYRFALSRGVRITVVATDAGLMPQAQTVTSWRHAPAERYEILVDFREVPVGTRVQLLNRSEKKNVDFRHTGKIMAFDVVGDYEPAADELDDPRWQTLPTTLAPVGDKSQDVMALTEDDAGRSRSLRVHRKHGQWVINGETWDDVVRSGYTRNVGTPDLGDVEVWELRNESGGWFHPVHFHMVDFQILDRNGQPPFAHERGPKDVAYVGPEETVRVLIRFGPHRGRYMVHCHNLPHEDHDMMHQFIVGLDPDDPDPNHPVLAAPPVRDDEP